MQMDFNRLGALAVGHVKEFSRTTNLQVGSFLINHFNPNLPHIYLFTDANWPAATSTRGLGFAVINSHKCVLIAGCKRIDAESSLEAKMKALEMGIMLAVDWCLRIHTTFIDCLGIKIILNDGRGNNTWREIQTITRLKQILVLQNPEIAVIPRIWNTLADRLAVQGRTSHTISLFHQGLDFPRWLMKATKIAGFTFE